MTIIEYQKETTRTLPDLGTEQLNVLHMIMGMNSEFNELYEATDDVNKGEELTDINWYLTNYGNVKKYYLAKQFEFRTNLYYYALEENNYIEMLQVEISKLTDLEKKAFVYKKDIADVVFEEQMVQVAKRLNDCYAAFNIDPFDSMQKNIDKLKARFPEKFTEYHANNRDLKKEREILEGN
jgi:hypothetical protein